MGLETMSLSLLSYGPFHIPWYSTCHTTVVVDLHAFLSGSGPQNRGRVVFFLVFCHCSLVLTGREKGSERNENNHYLLCSYHL